MIFKSDKFYYDGKFSEEMRVRLVTTKDDNVLMDYGVPFSETVKVEHSYGENPFYTLETNNPDSITMEFVLVSKLGEAVPWDMEWENKIVSWFMCGRFAEFISFDYPNLVYYLRGIKVSRRRNHQGKGIYSIEFQPYFQHPVKKFRKSFVSKKQRDIEIFNPSQDVKPIYPTLIITANEDEKIKIKNNSAPDSKEFVVDMKKGEVFKIDNKICIVKDKEGNNKFDKVNREWIYLLSGNNKIQITGNCRIEFNCKFEIKI